MDRRKPDTSGDRLSSLSGGVLLLGSAALYAYMLAPELLWDDDAMYQRALATGALTNHPLWGLLARLFTRLPLGNPAFRANLASAVYAVGAVGFLFLATLALRGNVRAAVAAGAALAVSHTFWLHAVRAEVYTLHMLLFFAGLWAFFRWRQTLSPGDDRISAQRIGWLALGLVFWGVGLINHLLLTMALPGGLWLILSALSPATRRKALMLGPLAVLGVVVFLYCLKPASPTDVVLSAARIVLTTFSLSWSRLATHLVILVYQFPAFGLLAIPGSVDLWRRDRGVAVSRCLMAVLDAAFVYPHSILDWYVFYMPVFGLMALCVGVGAGVVTAHWPSGGWLAIGVTLLTLQTGLYRITPLVVDRVAPGIIPSRDLPGRRASAFFLGPPKHGYLGARQFAEDTLELLPVDAILITDWTVYTPLQYLQDVEGRRRDVLLVQVDPIGMQTIWGNQGRRPLFLANADPRYYPMDELNARFQLRPVGDIFALLLRESGP